MDITIIEQRIHELEIRLDELRHVRDAVACSPSGDPAFPVPSEPKPAESHARPKAQAGKVPGEIDLDVLAEKIVNAIRTHGPMTFNEIVRVVGQHRKIVHQIIQHAIHRAWIRKRTESDKKYELTN